MMNCWLCCDKGIKEATTAANKGNPSIKYFIFLDNPFLSILPLAFALFLGHINSGVLKSLNLGVQRQ